MSSHVTDASDGLEINGIVVFFIELAGGWKVVRVRCRIWILKIPCCGCERHVCFFWLQRWRVWQKSAVSNPYSFQDS